MPLDIPFLNETDRIFHIMIHVCPLSKLQKTADATGAKHLITLISEGTPVDRPKGISESNHLFLAFNDVEEQMDGLTPPNQTHVKKIIDFIDGWDRKNPLLTHCWAGISRSTACAFIAICRINPTMDEEKIAVELREVAPFASPNKLLIKFADQMLNRNERMIKAIDKIGRGRSAYEGRPFQFWFDN